RYVAHVQQGLALARFRDGALGHFEMLGCKFSGRPFHQQNLAIDTIFHGFLPSMWLFLMQCRARNAQAAAWCICAMHMRLVGASAFHNVNIWQKGAFRGPCRYLSLNLVASALKSAKLDEPETDWGKTMSNRFTQ